MIKIYTSILSLLLISANLCAQFFSEQSSNIGIDHSYNDQALMGGGLAFFDYDNDGDEDFYITGGLDADYIYENNGDGTFSKIIIDIGLDITNDFNTTGVTTGDVDNDGDRDIFVTTWKQVDVPDTPIARNLFFLNNGDGTFSEMGASIGIEHEAFGMGANFLDYNKDGYLDIYVINHIETVGYTYDATGAVNGFAHDCYPNFLYRNNGPSPDSGSITFSEVSADLGVNSAACTLAAIPSDFDLDGDLDLYLANDFGIFLTPNQLFRNNYPDDNFQDISEASGADAMLFGMGIAAGDYDHDLDIDYYTTNLGRNVLFENNNSSFEDVTTFANVENESNTGGLSTSWGTAFLDVNNDSWEDLYVANGRIPSLPQYATTQSDPDKLFLNNGNKTFTDISAAAGVEDISYGRGMAYSDFDKDGDLDIMVVVLDELDGYSKFYINEIDNDHHYIQFRLIGKESNRDAFGSKVWLYAGGEIFLKELYGGGASHLSQHSSIMHFGLGTIDQVDSIRIDWTNGHIDHFGPFEVDQIHTLEEGILTGFENIASQDILDIKIIPNPIRDEFTIKTGQAFTDGEFSVQLISVWGDVILDQTMSITGDLTFSLGHDLPSGMYTLLVYGKEGRFVDKLMKF